MNFGEPGLLISVEGVNMTDDGITDDVRNIASILNRRAECPGFSTLCGSMSRGSDVCKVIKHPQRLTVWYRRFDMRALHEHDFPGIQSGSLGPELAAMARMNAKSFCNAASSLFLYIQIRGTVITAFIISQICQDLMSIL
jgi:hypothetical protein